MEVVKLQKAHADKAKLWRRTPTIKKEYYNEKNNFLIKTLISSRVQ